MRSSIFNFKFDRQRVVRRSQCLVLGVGGHRGEHRFARFGSYPGYLHEQNPDKMIYRRARESLGPETEDGRIGRIAGPVGYSTLHPFPACRHICPQWCGLPSFAYGVEGEHSPNEIGAMGVDRTRQYLPPL